MARGTGATGWGSLAQSHHRRPDSWLALAARVGIGRGKTSRFPRERGTRGAAVSAASAVELPAERLRRWRCLAVESGTTRPSPTYSHWRPPSRRSSHGSHWADAPGSVYKPAPSLNQSFPLPFRSCGGSSRLDASFDRHLCFVLAKAAVLVSVTPVRRDLVRAHSGLPPLRRVCVNSVD